HSCQYAIDGEAEADDAAHSQRTLQFEYQFDRLWAEKLAQDYELLVPDRIRAKVRDATPQPGSELEILNDETGRYLCTGILGPPEGEPHDRQPIGGLDGVCRDPRIHGSTRVALPG